MDFTDMNDKYVIKTVCGREKRKAYTGNIYLHFLKFVPERTKDQTPESWKKALRKHGLSIYS